MGSCKPAPDTVISYSDFEGITDTTNTAKWLTEDVAHSGSHSAMVVRDVDVAAMYQTTWGAIGTPKELRVRAWVYVAQPGTVSSIVVQVLRSGQGLAWQELKFPEVIHRFNSWVPLRKTFILPTDTMQASDELRVFLWQNKQVHPTYMDDLKIESISPRE